MSSTNGHSDKIQSQDVTEGLGRAPARAMFRAMGYDDEDLAQPLIGIANPAADVTPCNVHLDRIADEAREGLHDAGGTPIEFGTITVSDGISMGTEGMKGSLISREVIADSVELVAFAERLDGLVILGGCDKNMPGMMMAAIRADLPSVFLYGGSIMPGRHRGQEVTIQNVFEACGAVATGQMTEAELDEMERHACPGAGACGGMFTANTIASITSRPDSRATASRSSSIAGGLALPSGAKPIASLIEAIVLAVNMPPQDPAPGQAWRSISSSYASVICPVATAPHASNTF